MAFQHNDKEICELCTEQANEFFECDLVTGGISICLECARAQVVNIGDALATMKEWIRKTDQRKLNNLPTQSESNVETLIIYSRQ